MKSGIVENMGSDFFLDHGGPGSFKAVGSDDGTVINVVVPGVGRVADPGLPHDQCMVLDLDFRQFLFCHPPQRFPAGRKKQM